MFRTLTAAALLALSATAAQAATTQVSFGDLNLSRPQDVAILADRLEVAAKTVCLDANPQIGKVAMQACVNAAISAATFKIEDRLEQRALGTVHANLVGIRQRVANAGDVTH